jgi:WD40 repeat protein
MSAEHHGVDLVKDEHAWERLKEGLKRAGVDADSFDFEPGRRPYPGLEPLLEPDAAIFFGREGYILRGLDRLRAMRDTGCGRLLVILGASGSGKSSFLRAGLWPRLQRDDRNFLPLPVVRPERAVLSGTFGLFAALEQVLSATGVRDKVRAMGLPQSRGEVRDFLVAEPEKSLAILLDSLRHAYRRPPVDNQKSPSVTLVFCIDQGEELFNTEGLHEAELFMELVAATVATDRQLLVIVTIRSDAYFQLQTDARLASLIKEPFDLPPLPSGAFSEVITGPAKLANLQIEPALVDALLADATGADALPMLAFSLEHLYRNYGAGGELKLEHYERVGRISGIIVLTVKQALDQAGKISGVPPSEHERMALVRRAFIPHLVRINRANESIRRVAMREEIPAQSLPLIDTFVQNRLLLSDIRSTELGAETPVIEVAHEALLRKWPAMVAWASEESDFLKFKSYVEERFTDYLNTPADKREGALLSGNPLVNARAYLVDRQDELKAEEHDFIQKSIDNADAEYKKKRRNKLWLTYGSLAAVLVLSVLAGFFLNARNAANYERDLKLAIQARQLAAHSLAETKRGNATVGALLALEALPDPDAYADKPLPPYQPVAEKALYAALAHLAGPKVIESAQGEGEIDLLLVDQRHSALLYQYNQRAVLADSRTGEARARFSPYPNPYPHRFRFKEGFTTFSPNGEYLWTVGENDTEVLIRNVATGAVEHTLAGHDHSVDVVRFSPDSSKVLTVTKKGDKIRLWDLVSDIPSPIIIEGPMQPTSRRSNTQFVARFLSAGAHFLVGNADRTFLYQTTPLKILERLDVPVLRTRSDISHVQDMFARDGSMFLTAETADYGYLDSESLDIRSATNGKKLNRSPIEIRNHAVFFTPDGGGLITIGPDSAVSLFDTYNRESKRLNLFLDPGTFYDMAISGDGGLLVVYSSKLFHSPHFSRHFDKSQLYPDPSRIASLPIRERLEATFNAVPEYLKAKRSGRIQILDLDRNTELQPLDNGDIWIVSTTFVPGSDKLVTILESGEMRVWDARSGEQVARLTGHAIAPNYSIFDTDNRRMATSSTEGTVRIWDLQTGIALSTIKTAGPELVFAADGYSIITPRQNRGLEIWSLYATTDEAMTRAKGLVRRCLSADERSLFKLPNESPFWCQKRAIWPNIGDRETGTRLLKVARLIANIDVRIRVHGPGSRYGARPYSDVGKKALQECWSHHDYGSLLWLQALARGLLGTIQASGAELPERLEVRSFERNRARLRSALEFAQAAMQGNFRTFYNNNRVGTLVDYLLAYYPENTRLGQETTPREIVDKELHDLCMNQPIGSYGAVSLDEWLRGFWERRIKEKNVREVKLILEWLHNNP